MKEYKKVNEKVIDGILAAIRRLQETGSPPKMKWISWTARWTEQSKRPVRSSKEACLQAFESLVNSLMQY